MPNVLLNRSGFLAAFFGVLAGLSLGWLLFGLMPSMSGAAASAWPAWISAGAALCSAAAAVWMAMHSDKARSIEKRRGDYNRMAAVGALKNPLYMDMNKVIDVSRAYASKVNGGGELEKLLRKWSGFKLETLSTEKYYSDLPPEVAAPLVEGWVYQKFVANSLSRWRRTGDVDDLRYLVHRIEKYGEIILSSSVWVLGQSKSQIPDEWGNWRKLTNVDDLRTPR